jgi:5-methylcytosine-specific restriction protein B
MASGLNGHTVSLTKNGYFKLSELIPKYSKMEILNHLDEIKLDFEQARKMLAGNSRNVLPDAWDEVKKFDTSAQYALLLVSIIYSHKTLIELFKNSVSAEMQGVVKRSDIDVKVYTNLAYALNEAGVATDFRAGSDKTSYDFSPILAKNEIGPLAKEILKGHLVNMGWKEPTTTEPFQRTFYEQMKWYEFNKVLGISFDQFKGWLEGENIVRISNLTISVEPKILLQEFISSVSLTGLQFSDQILYRFISSLTTKPFVILSGLSGSGKTKLALAFAKWICNDKSQYCIIPVGADWTNREPLLGYPNALKPDEYIKPDNGALDVIIEANKHHDLPYFLILDEMNLSHVERYFADFLSVMESEGEISLFAEGAVSNGVPDKLALPSNLFIIGTVNIDETTYMFSPKVLDRTNAIEFRVTKDEIEFFFANPKDVDMNKLKTKGASMAQSFLKMAEKREFADQDLTETHKTLVSFFEQLKKTGAEFGYRSATEIIRLINQLTVINADLTIEKKLDIAIMQKLLPKLHGSRRKLCPILITLGSFCVDKAKLANIEKDVFSNEAFDYESDAVLYPISLEKITRMYKGAIENGFASYAEA